MNEKRKCNRCGKRISKAEHPNVIYCSERCSRPTVQEFQAHKMLRERQAMEGKT